jgi:GNAT superfamily N-acetyltransferase
VVALDRVDATIDALFAEAIDSLREHRGGTEMIAEMSAILAIREPAEMARQLAASGDLYVVFSHDDPVGLAALGAAPDRVVLGLFVRTDARRQGAGAELLGHLLSLSNAPRDAWVLPGDRSTKSLYERVGWKARRLTMSAG